MRVVILAGGRGTRLAGETRTKPKPMIEVAGRPLLWHIMSTYAAQGFTEFVIALGYRGDVIKHYFHTYRELHGNLTVRLADGAVIGRSLPSEDWTVHLVETGLQTATGGRLKRLRDWIGDDPFMMTYGDGVADVDLQRLVAFHAAQRRSATVTAVRPPARFGALTLDGDAVKTFAEKPHVGEGWINGGYFVLEPGVLDRIDGDDTAWERAPLAGLASDGELAAFRHDGFWQMVDTERDLRYLESLCLGERLPWRAAPACDGNDP